MVYNRTPAESNFSWREKAGHWFYGTGTLTFHDCAHRRHLGFFVSTRYEEAEVRKKLEEKDRQEEEQLQKQKKQEAGREDGGTAAKSSLENILDSKDKAQKVFQIYSVW